MTVTSNHTQACFDAWMKCESFLENLAGIKTSVSKKVTQVIDECSLICMGTFNALKTQSANLSRIALLCVGICEECADLCEEQKDPKFQELARSCRQCSETMSHFAFPAAMVQQAVPTNQ